MTDRNEKVTGGIGVMGERPDVETRKSSMPIVAAAVTFVLAGVAVLFVFVLGGSSETKASTPDAAIVAPSAGSDTTVPEPTAPTVRAPEPKPPTPTQPATPPTQNPTPTAARPTTPTRTPASQSSPPQTPSTGNVPVTRPDGTTTPVNTTGAVTSPTAVPVDAAPAEVRAPATDSPAEPAPEPKPE